MNYLMFKKYIFIFIVFISSILNAQAIGRVMKSNGTVLIKHMGSGTYSVDAKQVQAI